MDSGAQQKGRKLQGKGGNIRAYPLLPSTSMKTLRDRPPITARDIPNISRVHDWGAKKNKGEGKEEGDAFRSRKEVHFHIPAIKPVFFSPRHPKELLAHRASLLLTRVLAAVENVLSSPMPRKGAKTKQ